GIRPSGGRSSATWDRYPAPGVPGTSGACPGRPGNRSGNGSGEGSNRLAASGERASVGVGLPTQSGLAGADDRLAPVGDAELVEHVRDVVPDGLVADLEPPGDLGVRLAASDQLEHLVLAVGQLGERAGGGAGSVGLEERLEAGRDRLAEDHLADGYRAD